MSREKTPRRGVLRSALTVSVTSGVVAGAAALAIGGAVVLSERADAVPQPDPVPPVIVEAHRLQFADGYDIERRFFGQTEPSQDVMLGFETGGTLTEILADEGARVRKGDLIAQLDTRTLEARRSQLLASKDALKAQLALAVATAERQRALQERGFASSQRLDEVAFTEDEIVARIAEVDAGLIELDVQI
ncbi:MAG: biotin/lipoyl-binding protein [Rhodobacteraceae bacterium]|nr:biotin/lipoyl-binding protein [Paracoccaceae bacterium]